VVLVTGALDCVMRPLAEWVDAADLIAAQLAEELGVCTGALTGPPIGDEQKARLLRSYAAEHGIDLAQSFAYGNSLGDAPMLACVGHAVAVNPDRRLRALAAARGWGSVLWKANV
jgi:phosphoserine phosphatase